jgi:hypothetical protein
MPYLLIVLVVVARLLVHPFNFTPVGAIGLFAGGWCSPRVAWAVPLAALLISDAVGGFYDSVVMVFVYLGFLGGPVLGRLLLAKQRTVPRYAVAMLSAATVFYLVSNFGMWLSSSGSYPRTLAGLLDCYWAGLPFFRMTLVGDLFYSAILFGGAELLVRAQAGRRSKEFLPG